MAPNKEALDLHSTSNVLFSFLEFTKFLSGVTTVQSISIKSGYTRWKPVENSGDDNV